MSRPNLLSLFADFHRHRRDVAVVQRRGYRRELFTYGELARMARNCAARLKAKGIKAGDRVILWGPNSAEWMAGFWGCLLRGAVAVPIDDGATQAFAENVARGTSARFAFIAGEKPPLESVANTLNLEDLADSAADSDEPNANARNPEDEFSTLADEPITRGHVAQILFTSGTTAEPRGVVLTHGNFLANLEPLERGIEPYRKYERWLHPLRFVSLVPLSHVFGQFMALFVPPLLGSAVVFGESANAGEIIRTIKRERATALIAVPHMLELLRNRILRDAAARGEPESFRRTLSAAQRRKFLRRAWMFRRIHGRFGWKFWAFISGGAALGAETENFLKGLGYAVVQGYGMTETASLISLNHPFRATQGSIGKVLPGREFRLAADGEILVRGENVAGSYWQGGEIRGAAIGEGERGWLRTGDIGELDAQGNLRFRGRKKNVIVTSAGMNVYPEDLEAALRQQPAIRDCVVVPIDRNGNAEPCAVLLMNGADASGAQRAITGANRGLAEYQQIRCWTLWQGLDFPRTPTGKPRLAVIATSAAQTLNSKGGGVASQQRPGGSAPNDRIAAMLNRFTPRAENSSELECELNLTSLDRVELMSALEQHYQVELNETAFAEAKTLGDVRKLLIQPASRRTEYPSTRWTQREPVRWLRLGVYYALVWPATQILAHPRIVGREHLKGVRGPALVICNHVTRRADIGFVLAALPARFRHRLATAAGGETLQNMRRPPREWFFAKRWAYQIGYWLTLGLFNVFPLPRFSGFRQSFRFAGDSIDRGYSVLVFPEGESTKSETGEMQQFYPGIGLLAQNLRVPIVPMRLDGVWQMRRERRRLARFGEVTVRIGEPVRFSLGSPPDEIARQLQSRVKSL
jgi:long-chain acyl-CoA synthetase